MRRSNSELVQRKAATKWVRREKRGAAASRRPKSHEEAESRAGRIPATKVSVGAVFVEHEQQQLRMQQQRGQQNTPAEGSRARACGNTSSSAAAPARPRRAPRARSLFEQKSGQV